MEEEYTLKHKNITVATIGVNLDKYAVTRIRSVADPQRLPFKLETELDNPLNAFTVNEWIRQRGISATRSDYKSIMIKERSENATELAFRAFCLSLSDCYWLDNAKNTHDWNKINFFDNIQKKMLKVRIFSNQSSHENIDPDFGTGGNLPKGWLFNGKNWALIKEGNLPLEIEPYNEVAASKILQEFGIRHVSYGRKKIKTRQVSVCDCMTSKDEELLPAIFVAEHADNWKTDRYNAFITYTANQGIDDIRQKLDEMIAIDFLIANVDRHLYNFAILRNPNTLQWTSFAPLYDHGNSLSYNAEKIYATPYVDSYCKWGDTKSNADMLAKIQYPQWYSPGKLKRLPDIIEHTYHYNTQLPIERRDKIIALARHRMTHFEKAIQLTAKEHVIVQGCRPLST